MERYLTQTQKRMDDVAYGYPLPAITKSFFLFWCLLILVGCQPRTTIEKPVAVPKEFPVQVIPLAGEIAQARSEISGLTWHGDTLILLPQYPQRFTSLQDGSLFAIPKSEILAFLDGELDGDILPSKISLGTPNLNGTLAGFEGFEAIAIAGDRVYLTIESKPGDSMLGYAIGGTIAPDHGEVLLDLSSLASIEPQADLGNFSDEAILLYKDKVLTFYEAWGALVNPDAVAHTFDLQLNPGQTWPLPNIEYRITDVTEVRFIWAVLGHQLSLSW